MRGKIRVVAGVVCLILCILFSVSLVYGIQPLQAMMGLGEEAVKTWNLGKPLPYDKEVRRQMEQLTKEGMNIVFWADKSSQSVTNPDYNRSVMVRTLGIAGDISILFPGCNRLAAQVEDQADDDIRDMKFCILGEDTAWRLFGSTRVIGRYVVIGGEKYHITGIEFQEKELCAYGLGTDLEEEITGLGVRAQTKEQLEIEVRKLERQFECLLPLNPML